VAPLPFDPPAFGLLATRSRTAALASARVISRSTTSAATSSCSSGSSIFEAISAATVAASWPPSTRACTDWGRSSKLNVWEMVGWEIPNSFERSV
jgi:hypothetical protein